MAEIPDADRYRPHNFPSPVPEADDPARGGDSESEAVPSSPWWLAAGLVLLALLVAR